MSRVSMMAKIKCLKEWKRSMNIVTKEEKMAQARKKKLSGSKLKRKAF